jgi:cytochrome c oxidase subunit III
MNAINPSIGVPANAVNGASIDWVRAESIRSLPIDQARGVGAMAWFIASEAMVFVGLFFSYFYLGHLHSRWPTDSPPHIGLASAMMGVLLLSCLVLWFGRRSIEAGGSAPPAARGALLVAAVLGCVFLVLSAYDYNNHVRDLPPTTDSYSSIFYVIDGVHAAHLMLGVLMLIYALLLPQLGPTEKPPHTPYRNVAMYWYFVTVVYAAVYCILYLVPAL